MTTGTDEHSGDDEPPEAVAIEEERSAESNKPLKHVPVTLITGFLGAGKSTLVKHILSAQHGLRIAVILNEFGEEGGLEEAFFSDGKSLHGMADEWVEADHQFHTHASGDRGLLGRADEWVELTNGCMCCAVKSNFVQALEGLMARRQNFDYIVIETTGLANPGPIASALWTDEELEAGVQLDSVITVVDGLHISKQLRESRPRDAVNEAQVQIAFADLVLLNKLDLAEEEAVDLAMADIRGINSSVVIIKTVRCEVDLQQLLNRQGYSKGREDLPPILEDESSGEEGASETPETEEEEEPEHRVMTRAASFIKNSPGSFGRSNLGMQAAARNAVASNLGRASTGSASSSTSSISADHHEHDSSITTISLRSDTPLDLDKFKTWVDHLLWERQTHSDEVYRMKGVLCLQGSDLKHSFQAVYELYDIVPGPAWAEGETRRTRLTIIGRRLGVDKLRERFSQLAL